MLIVMVGNCQVQAMSDLYSRYVRNDHDVSVVYVRSYEDISTVDRQVIESADIIIEQVQNFRARGDISEIATSAKRIGVPVVHGGFLWPFAGQPHPQNPERPYREGGPYGTEYSDAYLNKLIKKGALAEEALISYSTLDIGSTVDLDRLLEVSLERQRGRDAATGFAIAQIVEAHFRSEQLFLTPYHPNTRISLELATQLFEKMNVPAFDIARMQTALRTTPFPKDELPIHPTVSHHFGLSWADEKRRYRFLEEGSFTFPEFVRRYVNCSWNEKLDEGLAMVNSGDIPKAYELLSVAVQQSPDSVHGFASLGHVLQHMGRIKDAIDSVRYALDLDPDNAALHLQLGMLLQLAGDDIQADREILLSSALDPFDSHISTSLARRLNQQKKYNEAGKIANNGLFWAPNYAKLYLELGVSCEALGDISGAEVSFQKSATLKQDDAFAQVSLAIFLERCGRCEESIFFIRDCLRRNHQSSQLWSCLANLISRHPDAAAPPGSNASPWSEILDGGYSDPAPLKELIAGLRVAGRLVDAEFVARRAISRFPKDLTFHYDLAEFLHLRGMHEAALAELDVVNGRLDVGVSRFLLRGEVLISLSRWSEAETALLAALEVADESLHGHICGLLGDAAGKRDDVIRAIHYRERACILDPGNSHRRALLGHTLLGAGRLSDAEREFRSAIALSPDVPEFRLDLSYLLDLEGRVEDALVLAREGLELSPNNLRVMKFIGHLLERSEDWKSAEETYRFALESYSADADLYLRLSRIRHRLGRLGEAISTAKLGIKVDPSSLPLKSYLSNLMSYDNEALAEFTSDERRV